MNYKSFDDFFTEGPNKNKESRVAFTSNWLKTHYRFSDVNREWVELISDVHDHDNQPLHFGQVKIGTAFNAVTTQLVIVHNEWHLMMKKVNGEEVLVHPIHEESRILGNDKNRLFLYEILRKGKVVAEKLPIQGATYIANPTALDAFSDMPSDEAVSGSAPVSDDIATTSVSVDLSAYKSE